MVLQTLAQSIAWAPAGRRRDRFDRGLNLLQTKSPQDLYRQTIQLPGIPPSFFLQPVKTPTEAIWPVDGFKSPSLEEELMLRDAMGILTDDILVKVDRASMRVALETRAPLLDHRIVEFAWTLPPDFKVHQGSGKRILKELLYRYVPKRLVDRPKMGFGLPLASWLTGPLRPWAESLLTESQLSRSELIHAPAARQVWEEFLSGRKNRLPVVWATLMFQAWYLER